MKNNYELFHSKYNRSTQIDETFCRIANTEGFESAVQYLIECGATKLYYEDYIIEYIINECTKSTNTPEKKEELLKSLLTRKYVKKAYIEHNSEFNLPEIIIETSEETINVIEFSKISNKIKEMIPFIETDGRMGKCFDLSYLTCINLGKPNELVTGHIYGYSDKSPFLHSWVETTLKGKEYVIDATRNAIINKEGYYLLKHAEPIAKISDDTIRQDIHKYKGILNKISAEIYFVFRDEIIRDLQRNEGLFDER